jgi:hypothetical protein
MLWLSLHLWIFGTYQSYGSGVTRVSHGQTENSQNYHKGKRKLTAWKCYSGLAGVNFVLGVLLEWAVPYNRQNFWTGFQPNNLITIRTKQNKRLWPNKILFVTLGHTFGEMPPNRPKGYLSHCVLSSLKIGLARVPVGTSSSSEATQSPLIKSEPNATRPIIVAS